MALDVPGMHQGVPAPQGESGNPALNLPSISVGQVQAPRDSKGFFAPRQVCFTMGPGPGQLSQAEGILRNCFTNFFALAQQVAKENHDGKTTIVSCCPMGRTSGLSDEDIANITLGEAKKFLTRNSDCRVLIVCYDQKEQALYEELVPKSFKDRIILTNGALHEMTAHLALVPQDSERHKAMKLVTQPNPDYQGPLDSSHKHLASQVPLPQARPVEPKQHKIVRETGSLLTGLLHKVVSKSPATAEKSASPSDLYKATSGHTRVTLSNKELSKAKKEGPEPAGLKKAMEAILEKDAARNRADLEIWGVSAASVRQSVDKKATFNPAARTTVTNEPFGSEGQPDARDVVIYSDMHFGGVPRSQGKFALEEVVMHSSLDLVRLQESRLIPLQRVDLANAGKGQSHASAIGHVHFDIVINTQKDVIGPDGKSLGKFYGDNAAKIHTALGKNFAKTLREQQIVKPGPKEPKTLLSQVAPTLAQRAFDLKTSGKGSRFAEPQEVEDYFFAVDAGMEALVQAKTAQGVAPSDIHYPAGWFGAGAFSNPGQLVALSQLTLASFRGINLVFHNVASGDMVAKRSAQLDAAKTLFEREMLPLIKAGATKGQVLAKLQEIAAREKWPIGDLNFD